MGSKTSSVIFCPSQDPGMNMAANTGDAGLKFLEEARR
jgi:hypothetical protein